MAIPQRTLLGVATGLASACLFGIAAPLAKLLLPRVDPWLLAGLFYCGGGAGLLLTRLVVRLAGRTPSHADRVRRDDWPLLAAITITGGGIGPVCLMLGLQRVSGMVGSLLLNLETVFTMLLAVTVFGDRLGRRAAGGCLLVLAGALVLSYQPSRVTIDPWGIAAIAAACFAWGLDNNLTARLAVRSPLQITYIKALGAGSGNLALALAAGRSVPSMRLAALALVIGFACYGVSIMLDVYALRYVGAAREAAFFAVAPFVGAIASMPLLGDTPTRWNWLAGAIMAAGIGTVVAPARGSAS